MRNKNFPLQWLTSAFCLPFLDDDDDDDYWVTQVKQQQSQVSLYFIPRNTMLYESLTQIPASQDILLSTDFAAYIITW